MFLQETYSIEDCLYSNDLTDNHNLFSITQGNANISHSSDGITVKGTVTSDTLIKLGLTYPTSFVAEYDIGSYVLGDYNGSAEVITSHTSLIYIIHQGSTRTAIEQYNENYGTPTANYYSSVNPPVHVKVVVNNGTITYYLNNSSTAFHISNCGTNDFGFKIYNNRQITIKNLKIKPL